MAPGRHALRRSEEIERQRTIEVVDARSGEAHFLTHEAAAAGRSAQGPGYVAVCGVSVLPAAMVAEPAAQCWTCVWVPGQRVRATR